MGVRIQELPETTGINKEDALIVEDGQGTKKGTVKQLDEALGVSQLKEDLVNYNSGYLENYNNLNWEYGYIDSGREEYNDMNIRTIDYIDFKKGDMIKFDDDCVISIVIYSQANSFIKYIFPETTQYIFDENRRVRIVFRYSDARHITDIHELVSKIHLFSKLNDYSEDMAILMDGKPYEVTPPWNYGYIESGGNEVYDIRNIMTEKIIHLGIESTITFNDGYECTVHYYDENSNWLKLEILDGNSKTFDEHCFVRIVFRPSVIENIENKKDVYDNITIINNPNYYVKNNYWKNKKIVWFGTSIPAGVVNIGGTQGENSYPSLIGKALGATVYNESVGSSEVRGGTHGSYVTTADPNGYGGVSAPGLLLSMSLSSSEKIEIMDNWETKWKNIITWYGEHVDINGMRQDYINASWDIKLSKYLSGGEIGQCDLYVFDHGYNDGDRELGFTELDDMPSDITDRRYWIGAMSFLFKKILEDNPKARILIVGHYCTDKTWSDEKGLTKYVCEAQEKLAKLWNIPIIKTWEHMGFSHIPITVNGNQTTVAQQWMPDDIHPASDTSGDALRHYANVLTPLISDIR